MKKKSKFGSRCENGLIVEFISYLISILYYGNIVNLFKRIAQGKHKFCPETIARVNIAIDLFVILKYVILVVLFAFHLTSWLFTALVVYLLFYNLYTYFYFHFWDSRLYASDRTVTEKKLKRRFINLIGAFVFSILCFAYLYRFPFSTNFEFMVPFHLTINSLIFSVANSFFVDSNFIETKSLMGEVLVSMQYVSSFIFLSIILSRSLSEDIKK